MRGTTGAARFAILDAPDLSRDPELLGRYELGQVAEARYVREQLGAVQIGLTHYRLGAGLRLDRRPEAPRRRRALCWRVREHGDEAAFAELVCRYQRQFQQVVRRFAWATGLVDCDEIHQEALIGFWNAAEVYTGSWRVPYGAVAFRCAENRVKDAIKAARRPTARLNSEARRWDEPLPSGDGDLSTLGDLTPGPECWQPR
jgi:hypothetical protein